MVSLLVTCAEAQNLTGEMNQDCGLINAHSCLPRLILSVQTPSGRRGVSLCVRKCFRCPCVPVGKQNRSRLGDVCFQSVPDGLRDFIPVICFALSSGRRTNVESTWSITFALAQNVTALVPSSGGGQGLDSRQRFTATGGLIFDFPMMS